MNTTPVCLHAARGRPAAFFVGDFNVGKSMLINALIRSNLLVVGREESRILPTILARGAGTAPLFAALTAEGRESVAKTHEQFLAMRWDGRTPPAHETAAVIVPNMPFGRLLLVDTPGVSSETRQSLQWRAGVEEHTPFIVIVCDVEYWPARHTLELVRHCRDLFGDRIAIAANMADQLNANEIRRIQDKAAQRMERFGMSAPPPFFTVSARLESVRRRHWDEYRGRVKREVRDLCDAGCDQLRAALYEYEAASTADPLTSFHELFLEPAARMIQVAQEGIAV